MNSQVVGEKNLSRGLMALATKMTMAITAIIRVNFGVSIIFMDKFRWPKLILLT